MKKCSSSHSCLFCFFCCYTSCVYETLPTVTSLKNEPSVFWGGQSPTHPKRLCQRDWALSPIYSGKATPSFGCMLSCSPEMIRPNPNALALTVKRLKSQESPCVCQTVAVKSVHTIFIQLIQSVSIQMLSFLHTEIHNDLIHAESKGGRSQGDPSQFVHCQGASSNLVSWSHLESWYLFSRKPGLCNAGAPEI